MKTAAAKRAFALLLSCAAAPFALAEGAPKIGDPPEAMNVRLAGGDASSDSFCFP